MWWWWWCAGWYGCKEDDGVSMRACRWKPSEPRAWLVKYMAEVLGWCSAATAAAAAWWRPTWDCDRWAARWWCEWVWCAWCGWCGWWDGAIPPPPINDAVGPGLGVQSSSRQPTEDGDGWVPSVVLHELSPPPPPDDIPPTPMCPLLLLLDTRVEPFSALQSLLPRTGTETRFGEFYIG